MSPAKRTSSARLFTRAKRILPFGVDSPVRACSAVGGTPGASPGDHTESAYDWLERARWSYSNTGVTVEPSVSSVRQVKWIHGHERR